MKLKYSVTSALFCALICVTTAFIKIPLAVTGYVHLGDAFVFLSCVFLPAPYAVIASGLGSAIADLLGGYALYAPVTLAAKCCMAFVVTFFAKRPKAILNVLGAVLATLCMAAVYFAYEWVLYGIAVSAANVPFNLMQGGVSAVLALFTAYSLKRYWVVNGKQSVRKVNDCKSACEHK